MAEFVEVAYENVEEWLRVKLPRRLPTWLLHPGAVLRVTARAPEHTLDRVHFLSVERVHAEVSVGDALTCAILVISERE